ncbi:MAG: alanine dehydrogenase [Clostridiales Family XIII bacterium]|jgi:alanine dehydrogenase|nr:alanine dehydrogenase [Clostridiales Family XIII bacterium]
MIVGLVKEIKNNEYRAGLTPNCVREYTAAGHTVRFERGAGEGAGFPDSEYEAAGGTAAGTADEVWATSDMVVKVKEPIASEYKFLREGLILYTYLHLAADKPLTDAMIASGVSGVAYETITDTFGGLPCLAPMSEIAGRMSVTQGAKYIEKTYGGRGVLLAGVPGVEKGKVAIIGGGMVGTEACKIAIGLGADVTILDVNINRLAQLDNQFGSRIQTLYSTPANIKDSIRDADIVVGAVLIPGRKAPKLVNRSDLSLMREGSVLVDVAVDQGGCFETTHATTHEEPIFILDGIVHYCVANMPGAVARTSTLALVNTTIRPGLEIANKGLAKAVRENPCLRTGVNIFHGKCVYAGVAEAFGLEYTDVMSLME